MVATSTTPFQMRDAGAWTSTVRSTSYTCSRTISRSSRGAAIQGRTIKPRRAARRAACLRLYSFTAMTIQVTSKVTSRIGSTSINMHSRSSHWIATSTTRAPTETTQGMNTSRR
jgi:hypothetical protein